MVGLRFEQKNNFYTFSRYSALDLVVRSSPENSNRRGGYIQAEISQENFGGKPENGVL